MSIYSFAFWALPHAAGPDAKNTGPGILVYAREGEHAWIGLLKSQGDVLQTDVLKNRPVAGSRSLRAVVFLNCLLFLRLYDPLAAANPIKPICFLSLGPQTLCVFSRATPSDIPP